MDIRQSFYTAIRNLYVNKLRFAQVMLSLVIAVAAVIVICNTCRLMVQQVETSWTPDILSNIDVYINTRVELDKRPTIENLDEIVKNNPDVLLGASPYITNHTMTGNVRYDNKYCKEAYFIGVNEKYADLENVNVQEGRFIQYMDCRREQNVCVVSGDIANKLMNGNAIGKTLNIWGINHTVIGVMEENSPDTTFNGLIYLPYTSAQKIIGDRIQTGYQDEKYYVNRFQIKANGIENLGNARRLIIDAMNELLGENNWSLTFASYLTLKGDIKGFVISQAFYYMLVVFAVLIVGGVGIMNVMLASVQERTKEIGIRKAFGATNKDIQRQFMLEAVITSLIGGLIGVVLGVILSFSIPWLVSDMTIGNSGMSYSTSYLEISLAAWPILLALGVSVGVGIIFGNYPAQQAAKLEPVAAINSD
ncbi:MAG: FtsX-like permease family protein [Peptococcaceae bacterium]|jgi:putative ABC transport system permease protein|nr:FtsX-like permease family protein [Peptococcaceae bacterium]